MPGTWCTKRKRDAIYRRDKGKCQYCGNHIPKLDYTIDHIVPRSRGGNNNHRNLILSCHPCNLRKGKKTLIEYLEYLVLEGIKSSRSVDYIRARVMSNRYKQVRY